MVKIPHVHVLLGPESGRKREFIQKLREQITKSNGEVPDEHRFYPYKTEAAGIVSLLQNSSLFSKHKLVLVAEAQEFKRKADVEPLVSYLESPNSSSTLVFLSDGYSIDKRIEKVIPKSQRQVFWELFDNQKRDWLKSFFQKQDITLESGAGELILDMIDNNTQDLQQECEKLALYFGPGSIINEDSIEKLIYHSKQENVFTLFERIVQRDFEASLETLQAIILSGADPVQLLGGLLWQFRKLSGLSRMLERQHGLEESYGQLKIRGKKNQRTFSQGTKSYTHEDLERIISLIARYEALLRSVRQEMQKLLIQLFLFKVVEPGRRVGKTGN